MREPPKYPWTDEQRQYGIFIQKIVFSKHKGKGVLKNFIEYAFKVTP